MKAKYFFLIAGLCLLADYLLGTGHGITFAMAVFAGEWDDSNQSYRKLLDLKIRNATWNKSYWIQWMGFIGGQNKNIFEAPQTFGQKDVTKPTGQPIEVLRDFQYKGRGNMDIPLYYPLTSRGIAGALTALSTGERPKVAYMGVTINQQRKVYLAQDSKMSPQLLGDKEVIRKLIRGGVEYLGDWFGRWFGFQPHYSFLEGASENLVIPVANGGLAFGRSSHMNFYVSGSGRVPFSNTKATYEAAVATAVNGLSSSNPFCTDTIQNAVYYARHNHRLSPMKYDGHNVYPMIISDAAALQLQNDTKWQNRLTYAAERSLKANPLFTGNIAGIYAGALIIIDETMPSVHTNAEPAIGGVTYYQVGRSTTGDTTGPCYGVGDSNSLPDYMNTPVDPGPYKPWIIFGASSLACGVAGDIEIDEEVYDFKQKKEVAAGIIMGMQRTDVFDFDNFFGLKGVGDQRYENTASVVGVTYSPSAPAGNA
jgi:hypothetical protein